MNPQKLNGRPENAESNVQERRRQPQRHQATTQVIFLTSFVTITTTTTTTTTTTKNGFSMPIISNCDACKTSKNHSFIAVTTGELCNQQHRSNKSKSTRAITKLINEGDVLTRFTVGHDFEFAEIEALVDTGRKGEPRCYLSLSPSLDYPSPLAITKVTCVGGLVTLWLSSLLYVAVVAASVAVSIRVLGIGFQPKWGIKDVLRMPKTLAFSTAILLSQEESLHNKKENQSMPSHSEHNSLPNPQESSWLEAPSDLLGTS
ncbi:hypothetical protein Ahy_B03g068427 isoform A [Arachis hypogaea]|uniref:Uncharacterized protein n=1 Tax=Arachis hypogaea TaxID=3818 RepID=A0A445A9P3_ARAHY|nr:hypothetical protein Ahy_B03g068427 isoform A [Arachis hypogaea]